MRSLPLGAPVVIIVIPHPDICPGEALTAAIQLKKDPEGPPLLAHAFFAALTSSYFASTVSQHVFSAPAGIEPIAFSKSALQSQAEPEKLSIHF